MRFLTVTLSVAFATLSLVNAAGAQECPAGFPVDCGTFCCESGAFCSGSECLIDTGTTTSDCCTSANECGWENDGVCDCDAAFAWDDVDCGVSAGTCPSGFPVDCGSFCCESGATCSGSECLVDTAPTDDCCTSGNACGWDNDGACDCDGAFTWDAVDCGTATGGCCTDANECSWQSDGTCDCDGAFAWDAVDCSGSPTTGECPTGYPVDCGTFCCESGATCSGDQCLVDSGVTGSCCTSANECAWANDGVCDCNGTYSWDDADCGSGTSVVGTCPAGYPTDCGPFCCPSGTTCGVETCIETSGTTTTASFAPPAGATCASDTLTTASGACSVDYCIETFSDGCVGYYVINGVQVSCSACTADEACAQRAAATCGGTGTTTALPDTTDGGCCNSGNTCGWANDGQCDCDASFAWDAADCGVPDSGASCCNADNTCNWDGDGTCDCDGVYSWDSVDCSGTSSAGCCNAANTCNWDGDGTCDCDGAFGWDKRDCSQKGCGMEPASARRGAGWLTLGALALGLVLAGRRRRHSL